MENGKVNLDIDYATNLVTIAFVCDLSDDEVRKGLIEAFREVKGAYRFDWLFDFTALGRPISLETAAETGAEWQRIAQGRDVGRRSAVISRDDRYNALIDKAQQTMPHRSLAFFATKDEGMRWLQSLGDTNQDGIQLI